jgi:hypothetical protein
MEGDLDFWNMDIEPNYPLYQDYECKNDLRFLDCIFFCDQIIPEEDNFGLGDLFTRPVKPTEINEDTLGELEVEPYGLK